MILLNQHLIWVLFLMVGLRGLTTLMSSLVMFNVRLRMQLAKTFLIPVLLYGSEIFAAGLLMIGGNSTGLIIT